MSGPISGDMQQILTTFDSVVAICENERWVKSVCPDDIKITFKMGLFIESTIAKLRVKSTVDGFIKMLDHWRKFKLKKTQTYPLSYYSTICDRVLEKFFKCPTINENVIDVAVRMYSSLFQKERFQEVVKNLRLQSASFQAISEFIVANRNQIDKGDLKFRLILNELTVQRSKGHIDKIQTLLQESVSICNVERCLGDLIGILTVDEENEIKESILEILLEKMNDRTILTKEFWLVLLQQVDTSTLTKAASKNAKFQESLIKFILYVGGMMEFQNYKWIGNPSVCLCPEITYEDLKKIIRSLISEESNKKIIQTCFEEANLKIWRDIMSEFRDFF